MFECFCEIWFEIYFVGVFMTLFTNVADSDVNYHLIKMLYDF